MKHIILFDFGSTFTKATVVSELEQKILFSTKAKSTVKIDAQIAYNECLTQIEDCIGKNNTETALKFASSSAAGGLRMSVCGLTQSLSICAGKNVSFGAGAKIVHVCAGLLTSDDIDIMQSKNTEILLFCGGYDDGNTSIILENALTLASSNLNIPIVYGGNNKLTKEIQTILKNKECYLAKNIIPNVGLLDKSSAEESIRNLFMKKIINMKGLSQIDTKLNAKIIPTPLAVLNAGELLSLGTNGENGLGELMIIDIGGATTDICSYAEHNVLSGIKFSGAIEPYSKRTVEGDLGMRESSDTLCQEIGLETLAHDIQIKSDILASAINNRTNNISFLANNEIEKKIDDLIAFNAIKLASKRHSGSIENIISINCPKVQKGKNLTNVKSIIGTGGQIVNNSNPKHLLGAVFHAKKEEANLLLPNNADLYIDNDYIMYAAGLLSHYNKELALKILKNSLNI